MLSVGRVGVKISGMQLNIYRYSYTGFEYDFQFAHFSVVYLRWKHFSEHGVNPITNKLSNNQLVILNYFGLLGNFKTK